MIWHWLAIFDVICTLVLPLLSQRTLHNYVSCTSLSFPLSRFLYLTPSLQLIPLTRSFLACSHIEHILAVHIIFPHHFSSPPPPPSMVKRLILLKLMSFHLLLIFTSSFLSFPLSLCNVVTKKAYSLYTWCVGKWLECTVCDIYMCVTLSHTEFWAENILSPEASPIIIEICYHAAKSIGYHLCDSQLVRKHAWEHSWLGYILDH